MVTVFVNGVDSYSGKIIAEVISGFAADYFPEGQKESASIKIIGTLLEKTAKKPKCVNEIVNTANKDALHAALMSATHIVYDITQQSSQVEEALWAIQALEAVADDFAAPKVFVCVSTIMTWAKTKPVDADDSAPIAEDEYRRRRAHLNFKAHLEAEKIVMKAGKKESGKLQTFVVASGLMYGEGENLFHRFFKNAWQLQSPHLECYGTGENVVPCIHVRDLGAIVSSILSTTPQTRYFLGVDEGSNTLDDITRAISSALGTGVVKKIPKENALADGTLPQEDYDSLLIDLRVEAAGIKELAITWIALAGFAETVNAVMAEYKKARNLTALKIVVLGPPGSGKSFLADQLSQHYKLPRVHVQGVIKATLDRLNAATNAVGGLEYSAELAERTEAAKEELTETRGNLESNGGRYSDDLLVKWFRETLSTGPCRNQGYVLDGFPKTTVQATDLFGGGEERNMEIMPGHVFALDATDEFLKERIMSLPESEVAGTHNSEEGLLRRLTRYRAENTEENTVLNYFDLLEIHPVYLCAESSNAPFERAMHLVGVPHNYGLTPEEKAILAASEAARNAAAEARASEERTKLEAALATEAAQAQAAWAAMRDEVQRQHAEARDQAALPLRAFLVKNVLPTLTKGLMELCETRPDDPIDYLAEYLFKNNPRIEGVGN